MNKRKPTQGVQQSYKYDFLDKTAYARALWHICKTFNKYTSALKVDLVAYTFQILEQFIFVH